MSGTQAIKELHEKKDDWLKLGYDKKKAYLVQARDTLENVIDDWAAALVEKAQHGDPASPDWRHVLGDAYVTGPGMFGAFLNSFIRVHDELGVGNLETGTVTEVDGRKFVETYPVQFKDKIFAPGFRGELVIEEGKEVTRGKTHHASEGGVAVVLGAGNYSAPLDILHKMFQENKVVCYKAHPQLAAATKSFLEQVFDGLIKDGFLKIVTGGIEIGQEIIHAEETTDVLITGGVNSYNCIMWGPPKEQAKNIAAGNKLCPKPLDAELGSVNPVFVTPTKWSESELKHQAAQVAACRCLNAGHTCAAPQVVFVAKNWPQRAQFVGYLKEALASMPPVKLWYPGILERIAEARKHYPSAVEVKSKWTDVNIPDAVSPVFIEDCSSSPEWICKNEVFGPVIAVLPMDVDNNLNEYLKETVEYANKNLWGNLSATFCCDSDTLKSEETTLRRAVLALRAGAIGVNVWGGVCVTQPTLSWAAFPGNDPEDIQSGCGMDVGNTLMYDNHEKAVLWTPVDVPVHIVPPKSLDQGLLVNKRLAEYLTNDSGWDLVKLLSAAVIGF